MQKTYSNATKGSGATANLYKNSSGDEIANVTFMQCVPEATRIRRDNAK